MLVIEYNAAGLQHRVVANVPTMMSPSSIQQTIDTWFTQNAGATKVGRSSAVYTFPAITKLGDLYNMLDSFRSAHPWTRRDTNAPPDAQDVFREVIAGKTGESIGTCKLIFT
jgi:hypothetical protein